MSFSVAYVGFSIAYYATASNADDKALDWSHEDWSHPLASGKLVGQVIFVAVPTLYAATCLIMSCWIKRGRAAVKVAL